MRLRRCKCWMMGEPPVYWCEIISELGYIYFSLQCGLMVFQIMLTGQFAFFFVTMFIALTVAFGFTSAFGGLSSPPDILRNIPLFVLTSIWPGAYVSALDTSSVTRNIFFQKRSSAFISLIIVSYVVLCVLSERRPFWIYCGAIIAFVVAQVFRLSPVGVSICKVCLNLSKILNCMNPILCRALIIDLTGHLSPLSWRQYQ